MVLLVEVVEQMLMVEEVVDQVILMDLLRFSPLNLGGSQYNNATIIISQLTPVSITQDIVDNQGTTNEINPFSITRYITPGLSGTEGHPVGSILYTVNILDYTNPILTARVLNNSLLEEVVFKTLIIQLLFLQGIQEWFLQ